MYQHDQLQWQFDFQQGPRLFNLRILVCPECLDIPQENGRTIVLPPDPIPIQNPRPEAYALADNPLSYLGWNAVNLNGYPLPPQTGNIGNMTLNSGVDAAFDGNSNKRAPMSAALSVSISSFQNYVGKNWNAFPSGITATTPSTAAVTTHVLSSYALYAPYDQPFLNSATPATGYHIDGSVDGANWVTLASGTTAGTAGEIVTGTSSVGTYYQYHRAVIQGDGISAVYIAQAVFSVSDQAPNDI
jgi:hypothetical protein